MTNVLKILFIWIYKNNCILVYKALLFGKRDEVRGMTDQLFGELAQSLSLKWEQYKKTFERS